MHDAFKVHMLTEEGKAKAKVIAEAFDALLTTLDGIVPTGRLLSIVTTKLEEASFFAKKAMAERNSEGSL